MADLSAYIDFTVVLSKAVSPPKMIITDPNHYPVGVGPTAYGYFEITQPDGLTVTEGSFGSPSIYWSGGSFIQPPFDLRLNNIQSFQTGGYTVKYYLRAPGYDDTTLTKVFTINYARPTVIISDAFDLFTPILTVTDNTSYTQQSASLSSVSRAWSADIISVGGVTTTIGSMNATFDLNYLGDYYDAQYNITGSFIPTYALEAPNDFVTVVDQLLGTGTFNSQTPQTVAELDQGLQTLKDESDAACGNCNTGKVLRERFIYASALYGDFRRKGCDNELASLTKTYFQLIKLFNNNVNPPYEHTNDPIPSYDFECGSGGGSVAWADITGKPSSILIEWTVGTPGFPAAGATTLVDSGLLNVPASRLIVVRNAIQQFSSNQMDGDTYYTKISGNNFLTFSTALLASEKIIVVILAI